MFERFTERARRVVVLAREQAEELNHGAITPGHLLLGLLREGEGVGAQALGHAGVELQTVQKQVLEEFPQAHPAQGELPFTPASKKALELSLREALQLGHSYVGTEHLALGLIREGSCSSVLGDVPLEKVRQIVIRLLRGVQPQPMSVEVTLDWTAYDLIIFTPEHPDGLFVAGGKGLEDAWEYAESQLLPRRVDRIKWEAAKELLGGRREGSSR